MFEASLGCSGDYPWPQADRREHVAGA